MSSATALPHERQPLRQHLLAARRAWAQSPEFQTASAALGRSLQSLLSQLEPEMLGVYWPLDGEFSALQATRGLATALPFARRGSPPEMHYRRWDGSEPTIQDECGIPSCAGVPVLPDVVLVPCVGFTREGFRLGYGGGYFDAFCAAHPGVTTIGLAWSGAVASFGIEAHDRALTVIVTEREVIVPD